MKNVKMFQLFLVLKAMIGLAFPWFQWRVLGFDCAAILVEAFNFPGRQPWYQNNNDFERQLGLPWSDVPSLR